MLTDDIFDPDVAKRLLSFIRAADEASRSGVTVSFTCPICGGPGKAYRSEYNGHLHAHCGECGRTIAQ